MTNNILLIKPKNMSVHFTLQEMQRSATASANNIKNVANDQQKRNLIKLCSMLEVIRYNLGNRAIKVNSGFRCPELNKLVGGVEHSRHQDGKAADIYLPYNMEHEVQRLLDDMKSKGLLRYWYKISDCNYHVDIP